MKTLTQIFNDALMDEKPRKPKVNPPFKIKPSSLGSPCERKIYYGAAQVPEDYGFDLAGKKRMALGDAVHTVLRNVFKKAKITISYVNPDGTPHKRYGFMEETEDFPLECADLFINNAYTDEVVIIDGELWLLEYKSINLRGFTGLFQAKPDHIIQAVTYWYVFNLKLQMGHFAHIPELQGFTKAKGVRWLYVNKDDTDFKEFHMTEGDKVFSDIVEKIFKIKAAYDSKTLPPKSQDFCNSCNWRDKCKKDYNIP